MGGVPRLEAYAPGLKHSRPGHTDYYTKPQPARKCARTDLGSPEPVTVPVP